MITIDKLIVNGVWLEIDYRVGGIINDIVSVRFDTNSHIGGRAGDHIVPTAINFDLKTVKVVNADELLCSQKRIIDLSPLARSAFVNWFARSRGNRFLAR